MNQYSPFEKGFEEITIEDLEVLREVNEGWYIEYKQAVPKSTAIAKSISAFANSYGGWIFYGIKELSKENSVAGDFLGIEASELDAALQKIRQAVANMSPACHFETKTLNGPCEKIGLASGRSILCVVVPQSIEAPHVHSAGYIYRRVSDGSEPLPETDRNIIEKLFERSKKVVSNFKEWHEKDPEFSKAESEAPYLRIMIAPNLWGIPRSNFQFNLKTVKEVLGAKEGRTICLPFDTIYSRAGGFIARQCLNNNPTQLSTTWDLESDLTSDITVPLSWLEGNLYEIRDYLAGYTHSEKFIQKLANSQIEEARVVDLNVIHRVLLGIIGAQRDLQKMAGWPLNFHIKIKLLNVWRTIPFLDTDFFMDNIEQNGVPMCLTKKATSPQGYHPESFFKIKEYRTDEADSHIDIATQTLFSFIPIATAYGIPLLDLFIDHSISEDERERKDFYLQLIDASKKAMEAQHLRTRAKK
jgi:hypothetical protein